MSLTGAAFLCAYMTALGFALFRHPIYGLYAYIAVFYLHPPSRWWGETLPDLRWALLAAIVTLIATWRLPANPERTPWLKTTPARVLVLFTIWFWLQNFWALEPADHFNASILFTKYVLLYYLVYRLAVTSTDISRVLLVHVAGCAYLGWLALSVNFAGRLEGVGGPGIDESNAFAMQMGTGIAVAAVFSLSMSGVRRWCSLFALPLMLNGIVLAGSRGGFLALLGAGLVLWRLKALSQTWRFYVYAVLGCALFGYLAHETFWARMATIETAAASKEEEMDTSALSRFALVEAQLKMSAEYPHGTGHRGTATLSRTYLEQRFLTASADGTHVGRTSHNTFMTALVEQGIPGAVFYLWLWGWILLTVMRMKRISAATGNVEQRSLLAAIAAALVVVFIAGVFVDYIKTEVQVWLWALLASIAATVQVERQPAKKQPSATRRPRGSAGTVPNTLRPAGRG